MTSCRYRCLICGHVAQAAHPLDLQALADQHDELGCHGRAVPGTGRAVPGTGRAVPGTLAWELERVAAQVTQLRAELSRPVHWLLDRLADAIGRVVLTRRPRP